MDEIKVGQPGRVWIVVVALLLLFVLGVWIGWRLYSPKPPVQEGYAASAVQSDGSVILARTPDAAASAPMQAPKGSKVERVVKITAKAGSAPAACPPVTVDLALIRQPDQTRRVIASSPDGVILSGVDIPVEAAAPGGEQPKWAAGVSYDTNRKPGVWLDRDLGPFRASVSVRQADAGGVRGEVRAGIRF